MAEVQLKLGVIFDQAVLRAQIAQATRIVNSEFTGRLNVRFNRQTLDKELNNLQRAIKRRVYRVEIGGNIDALPLKIKNLREQLKDLDGLKVNLGVTAQASLTKKEARKIRTTIRQQVIAEGGKIALPVTLSTISQTAANKFKADVLRKIGTLTIKAKVGAESGFAAGASGAAGLMEYMRTQGLVGKTASGMTMQMRNDGNDIKQQLNDAVKSAQKIKSIFDGVAGSLATTGKSVANVQGKRLGLTNVPLMAGAVERRVERSAESIAGTTSAALLQRLYPEINATVASLSTLRGQILRNSSKLSDFSLIIGLAAFAGFPFAKSIVKLTDSANNFAKLLDRLGLRLESATTKAAMAILNAASSRLLGGGSVAGLLPAAYRGIGAAAGPAGLLPPAYRGIGTTQTAGALPPAYRGLPFGFSFEALPSGAGGAEAGGALVALESGFIPQMRERFARHAKRFLFGIETQVVDLFDATRQAVNSAVDQYIASVQSRLSARARSAVRVQDLGAVQQPLLTGARIAGALPAAVGRTPSRYAGGGETREQMFARRTAEAYARSALRGMDVMGGGGGLPMIAASGGGGGAIPPAGGGRGFGGFGDFGRAMGTINLPGVGIVREIGQEFGFAAKQVLLFGAAYKGLAFIQNFPAQVGAAVGQLQSFRNTLAAVSPTAQEAAASNSFILSIVEKYNIPLQSARDGFTKLYASMAPAGFNGEEIRGLFLGISQAAATFGMSADRVDRVNYAFAQMASKGQVMSEELKGQLGDVLPGAMAIFAEAAGFKGPEAITKFSQALEQGAYKGEAMKTLLTNVGIVMRQEFGPGAEGAARTFQGVINRLQNSTKLLYESFEPVAVGFLNSVVVPLTNGVKTVADGFNAFFTGTQAKTIGGSQFAQQLKDLQPALEGIGRNLSALAAQFGQFASIAGEVGKILLQIAGNPIVGYLAKLYAIALPINMALGVMRGLWAANALQLLVFNARVASGTSTLTAFRGMMAATGATAQATAASIRAAGLTLRTFFATTGVGLVVAGISVLIERFMSMNQALADTRAKAFGAAQAIRAMSQTEALQELRQAQAGLRLLNTLQARGPSYPGSEHVPISKQEGEQLRALGIPATRTLGGYRMPLMNIEAYKQRLTTVNIAESEARLRQIAFEDRGTGQTTALAPITPTAEGAKPKKGRQMSMDALVGGDIKRRMDLAMAAIGPDIQRRLGAAGDDAQSKRMINYLGQYRKIAVELSAVQETIATVESRRAVLAANGINVEEKLADLKAKQTELAYELEEVTIKQYNDAKEAYGEEQARRQSFVRDLEDIRIKNGQIPEQQARQIELARQYEDIIARYPFLTEQQKLELQSAIYFQQEALGPLSERIKELRKELDTLTSTQEQVKFGAEAIGSSFAQSFKDAISGAATAQEALAAFFQRIGDSFLDMAARMIQKWIEMKIIGLAQSLLPGMGSFAGLTTGMSGGFSTGAAFSMAPGSIPAAGGITMPSFTPFATGGIVTGPTLGLVGEGRYNEAVVPLPDGRSIPVELGGAAGNQIISNITVNVNDGQTQSNATGGNSSELGRKLEGAVKQVIVGELRPGGLLAGRR